MLGAAQGLAEVVPVSSSAQLVLLPWLLRWEQPRERTAFAAALHAGSCAGIAWALREDLRRLSAGEVATLAAVSVPAAVTGALAADRVEARLGRPPQLAALLAGAGALMWWVDARAAGREARLAVTVRPHRTPAASTRTTQASPGDCPAASDSHRDAPVKSVDSRRAALAAAAQVTALVPGVSRLGATLTALRAAGVQRAEAERFSLLMSLPVTAGAAALTLAGAGAPALRRAAPGLSAGAAAAALTGAAAATRLRARPGRPLTAAALYRLGLAAVVARRLIREGAA